MGGGAVLESALLPDSESGAGRAFSTGAVEEGCAAFVDALGGENRVDAPPCVDSSGCAKETGAVDILLEEANRAMDALPG